MYVDSEEPIKKDWVQTSKISVIENAISYLMSNKNLNVEHKIKFYTNTKLNIMRIEA